MAAFIGLSSKFPSSVWNAAEILLYLAPLAVLFAAFLSNRTLLVPSPESLETFFPTYPVRTLRDAIRAMIRIREKHVDTNNRKAARLDAAVILTAVITAIVLGTQAVIALR